MLQLDLIRLEVAEVHLHQDLKAAQGTAYGQS